ncbi:MAG TPA: cupin domain-containing protein [Caldimonas sp.]|nr:cupin domain-containing protein [Caldimonas sp.]
METDRPLALLGGLSASTFMRTHWQARPLLVRSALRDVDLHIPDRSRLFELAARDDVESRLVIREGERWSVRHGPFRRRALPPLTQHGWTLLVQGVDLHDDAAHDLLARFRFISDARLDDAMFSYASDGGGVGPHVDSYDVFLLQTSGRRRWRIGRARRARLRDDVPLKILRDFVPSHDWLLEPGDMLYLPPGWAHEGTAQGPCITCSIGFRAPATNLLAADVLQRLAETRVDDGAQGELYGDRGQAATVHPGRIPAGLQRFADAAVGMALRDREARRRALGEVLSEPKRDVWFEAQPAAATGRAVVLDRRSRMLYDARHVFINGEAYRAGGGDATLMRRLADARRLCARDVQGLSRPARRLLGRWVQAGWCVEIEEGP